MDKVELAAMIARRDSISLEEAFAAIDECADMLRELMEQHEEFDSDWLYNEATDILADTLNLEPDYLMDILDI